MTDRRDAEPVNLASCHLDGTTTRLCVTRIAITMTTVGFYAEEPLTNQAAGSWIPRWFPAADTYRRAGPALVIQLVAVGRCP